MFSRSKKTSSNTTGVRTSSSKSSDGGVAIPQSFQSNSSTQSADGGVVLPWSSRGSHVVYSTHEQISELIVLGKLGNSNSVVSRVQHINTGRLMARKEIRFPPRKTVTETAEIKILKRLSHRHITKLVGSYQQGQILALLLSPVAECHLGQYLMEPQPTVEGAAMQRWRQHPERQWSKPFAHYLGIFYGCLANALKYLHDNGIRHKDIKPANILVNGTEVYLADFGISRDISEASKSDTSGRPAQLTRAYSAPEVLDWDSRGRAADVWSLGCVFLEMSICLFGRADLNLNEFRKAEEPDAEKSFAKNPQKVAAWIAGLQRQSLDWCGNDRFVTFTARMVARKPEDRPTAGAVWQFLRREGGLSNICEGLCGKCCLRG
ncbi:MAG: hypothetical protein M1835_007264 [Candelina submexicana]|nr:MAG: hypothetical protein M1835_007264 [Candelina submexicana]